MKPVCELIVQRVLPAIRALLAQQLLSAGMSQAEVAKRLGVTQAAVSQYATERRGSSAVLERNAEIVAQIERLAARLTTGALELAELCAICEAVRRAGLLCEQHRLITPGLEGCARCTRAP